MFAVIQSITALFFVMMLVWSTNSLNKVLKGFYVIMMLFGAVLIMAHSGISINDHSLHGFYNTFTIAVFFIITAVHTGWLTWLWSRNTWLNVLVKFVLCIACFSSLFYAGIATGIVS